MNELTDAATQKHLCILVRYYSDKKDNIQTSFMSLLPVIETIGQILFNKIVGKLSAVGQSFKNCIRFVSDGPVSIVGSKNSVWSRIKNNSPNCAEMK